jgi:amidase
VTDTTWLDATDQARLVRTGQVTPAELVDAAVERARRVDPQLSALVRDRFDAARAEARGDLPRGPFQGVPLLLKDVGAHLVGEATHYGTSFLRDADWRSPDDSHLGREFRLAGFVVLGRTRVPELATTVTTESAAYGATRNPWDPRRSPGGSSGGSAAAVAAGIVPVAHGGDGGGSLRIPAALCGLVGLKPSRGRVSQGPQVGESWGGLTVDGALTRTVRDTAAVLQEICLPMPGDPYSAPGPYGTYPAEVGVRPHGLRVGLLLEPPQEGIAGHPECRAAVEATGRLLETLGHHVEIAAPATLGHPDFSRHYNRVLAADVALTLEQFGRALGRDIADDELEPRNQAYRGLGRSLSAVDYLASRHWLARFSRQAADWWAPAWQGGQNFDVLVTPTVNGLAPVLGELDDPDPKVTSRRIREFLTYTPQFNVTGQPAVSLPLYWTADGLPVGVQLVAAYGREDLLIRLASHLELAAPWRDRRPPVHA